MLIFGCAGSLFLPRLFSGCDDRGYSLAAGLVLRLLLAVASLVAEHRL